MNPVKRQYLHPHKFGSGLKFMEFTDDACGPLQGLAVLLMDGGGGGGGSLNTANMAAEELALVGSWAGDPVVVAGDYGTPWRFVPDDLRGRAYQEVVYKGSPFGEEVVREGRFGFQHKADPETGALVPRDEDLYQAAWLFFEDVSDAVIKIVARAEASYGHPWAALDLAEEGWRERPQDSVLPKRRPRQPAGGEKAYRAYAAQAVTPVANAVSDLLWQLQRHPEQAREALATLKKASKELPPAPM